MLSAYRYHYALSKVTPAQPAEKFNHLGIAGFPIVILYRTSVAVLNFHEPIVLAAIDILEGTKVVLNHVIEQLYESGKTIQKTLAIIVAFEQFLLVPCF